MVQDGGVGNSLIWVPTDEPPHMGGSIRAFSRQLEACRGAGSVRVEKIGEDHTFRHVRRLTSGGFGPARRKRLRD